jgi:ribonuclease T2
MTRRDAAVLSISAALAVTVVVAVAYSLLVLDRKPAEPPIGTANSSSSLLVLTWGPSLCKVEPSNSGCQSGSVGKRGRTFVLHGLWPQPINEQYCELPKRAAEHKRNPVPLPEDLQQSLKALMSDSEVMTTHEWYAHGTCSGVGAPEYFAVAAALAEEAVRVLDPLFTKAPDRVSSLELREAFDAEFGRGAGGRIGMDCRNANGAKGQEPLAYEVKLSLPTVAQLSAEKKPV